MNDPHQNLLGLNLGVPDRPIATVGQCRAFSGQVMEEVILHLFNLKRGTINGTQSVCPDGWAPGDRPSEAKSLKRGSKFPIYKWRLEKDPEDQLYFVGIHKRGPAKSMREVWEGNAETLERVIITSVPQIRQLVKDLPLQTIKKERTASGDRNGYQRKGYKDGYWNISYKSFLEGTTQLPFRVSTELHGLRFECFVNIHPSVLL